MSFGLLLLGGGSVSELIPKNRGNIDVLLCVLKSVSNNIFTYIYFIRFTLVGGLEHFLFSHILGC